MTTAHWVLLAMLGTGLLSLGAVFMSVWRHQTIVDPLNEEFKE